ncbi:23S rRNA pseudouridine2457 synthase [Mesonia phycicola]|uniref:Pseudouridine synthase n=1 Tax=Mesonia phycicola TaxID=579105 RepID=A0A1M6AA78_9FLAO|nr:pseudouridine synthase [Mesonia phycicola]SHI33370.1 23S rRNA pseudouridine2457 synthase [Mesonia phycicola]
MHSHFKLYKPYGYLSQFITNQKQAKKKKMLGELYNFPTETMSIGRLDEDSEGLLLLSTDGKMSYAVLSNSVEKEYYVQVDGIITDEAIKKLQLGVEIGIQGKKYLTQPCQARIIEIPNLPERAKKIRDERHGPTSWASITITEGKFRQVKKMTAAVGFPTLRLVRYRVDKITIDKMTAGEVIEITETLNHHFPEVAQAHE